MGRGFVGGVGRVEKACWISTRVLFGWGAAEDPTGGGTCLVVQRAGEDDADEVGGQQAQCDIAGSEALRGDEEALRDVVRVWGPRP